MVGDVANGVIVGLAITDVLGLGAIVAVCAGLLYLGYRIEPHWVAKDASRFLTVAQELDRFSTPIGRKREVRVRVDREAARLEIGKRSLTRPTAGVWKVTAKFPNPPRGREVYLLRLESGEALTPGRGGEPSADQLALRVPASSKVVPVLDAMLP